MFKENKFKILVSSVVTLLPMLFGFAVWNKLPNQMAIHWGADGNPDGFSSKAFAVIFLPLIVLAIHLVCLFVSKLDPKNKEQHNKVIGLIFWICPAISVLCSAFMYLHSFDIEFNVGGICIAFMGLLFIIIGNYMPKCKQNYTIGIKIPWTLNDEINWNATHRFAGRIWVICGIIMLPCAVLPTLILPWLLVAILPMVMAPIIYSYSFYKKQNKD